ncbi:hypothetical protein DSO57_1002209 [Entomophthora muscae]|uniref:Uncharacterized protein n=1 Tax=Entomophthora muscae TaxID=34485 RepID=A0ACC2U817_9FUNG|nr:hypothetical protein DSO57_1002209 [Entomophthora muscae]
MEIEFLFVYAPVRTITMHGFDSVLSVATVLVFAVLPPRLRSTSNPFAESCTCKP